MGLGDWWRRVMKREDDETVEHALERQDQTPEEQRYSSGDLTGLEDDQFAARTEHEPSMEDADRLGES
jgi:hypothetical protein